MKNFLLACFLGMLCAPMFAQNAFYKSTFIYAHTFEEGLNDGLYRNIATQPCLTFAGMTVPSVGGPDPKVPVVNVESTGASVEDTSFDPGGLNARCFPQISTTEEPSIIYNNGSTILDNLSLTFVFSSFAEAAIEGFYFEAGQVNMSGLFQMNSIAEYRVVVHEGDLYGPEIFASDVLKNELTWNQFFVPFTGVNTLEWAGKTITIEIRFWNNGFGHPFFRFDDLAIIGSTVCDRGEGRIGNLVWNDLDNNGIRDGGELGIPNVKVSLFRDDGDGIFNPDPISGDGLFGQKITDADGAYYFESVVDGDYFICIDPENFRSGGALDGLFPSTGLSISANDNIDNQHHGIVSNTYKITGVHSTILGLAEGTEPITDGDDDKGNLTLDFGFYSQPSMSIGNLVFEDYVENGEYRVLDGEIGLPDVIMELYEDTDLSGSFNAGDLLLDITKTDASGNYTFTGLLAGEYIVAVSAQNFDINDGALKDYALTRGNTAVDPDDDIDQVNDGTGSGYSVVAHPITLALNTEPINDGDTDNNTNFSIDFGFYNCNAVLGEPRSHHVYGGDSNEQPESFYPTSDGGYIMTGWSLSSISGDKSENSIGSFDYWVIKVGIDKQIEWENTIGGTDSDRAFDVIESSDGNYYVVGGSSSGIGGDKSEANMGSTDVWVVKLSNTGTIIWENAIGTTESDILYSLKESVSAVPTNDGGLIMLTSTAAGIDNDKTVATKGLSDFWLMKINSAGTIVWQNSIGGISSDYASALIETSDGGYLIAGRSLSGIGGDKTMERQGSYDYWAVKTNSTGTVLWDAGFGGSGEDHCQNILETADGGFILAGTSASPADGDKSVATSGTLDVWLVKINSTGTFVWEKSYGGAGIEHLVYPANTKDGNVILAMSSTSGAGGQKTEPPIGGYDFWIVKIDNSGNILWDSTIGGQSTEDPQFIQELPNGNFFLGGTHSLTATYPSGDIIFPSNGSTDFIIMEIHGKTTSCDIGPTGNMIIGNLVWEDTNNDGIFNGAETGIENVQIALYVDNGDGIYNSGDDYWVMETVSNSSGGYKFENLPPDNYFVVIQPDNFQSSKSLFGMRNSTGMVGGNSDLNEQDHGTDTQASAQFGVISGLVTLTENGEPTNDGDNYANSNLTIDFGFNNPPATMRIGNLIFQDTNNNSFRDAGEPVIPNVTVELYGDIDGDEMLNTGVDKFITSTTSNGLGIYGFSNLAPGKYFVNIPASNWSSGQPLANMKNSTAFGGNDFDNDNDDAGVEEMHYDEANQGVASSVLTLEFETEPIAAIDGDDNNGNMTVDFGFYFELKLGDYVWFETDNNGSFDLGETPIQDVRLDLFMDSDDDGIFNKDNDAYYWSAFTDTDGKYLFDRLGSDVYFVRVSPRNFKSGKALYQNSSSKIAVGGDSDLNDMNHGLDDDHHLLEGIRSSLITLGIGTEPTNDGDSDDNTNLSIDFSFLTSSLCGAAWYDTNKDGFYTSGEMMLEGIEVRLYDASTNMELDMQITSATGTYEFNVGTGIYYIEFEPKTNIPGINFIEATWMDQTSTTLTDTKDSDIHPTMMRTANFNFTAGDAQCNIDGGFVTTLLPIELNHFEAQNVNCVGELKWSTVSEENNAYFLIEKKINDGEFEKIGKIVGAGNSTTEQFYSYADRNLEEGKNYYRLKQVDYDGSFYYSEIEVIHIKGNSECISILSNVSIAPNPTTGKFNMDFQLSNDYGMATFKLQNTLGQILIEQDYELIQGNHNLPFDLSDFAAGVYTLSINAGELSTPTYRIIKID